MDFELGIGAFFQFGTFMFTYFNVCIFFSNHKIIFFEHLKSESETIERNLKN